MSGRISAIDAIDSRPIVLYVGTASGGLWRSANGGVKFKPVFDDHCQSIGAIRIDQNHPDTVWVGTGEPWTRNSVSVGDGIYKSTDGGKSWKNMGLEDTERIGRIIIHPESPDTVYVAAQRVWGPYNDIKGGSVHAVDPSTGAQKWRFNTTGQMLKSSPVVTDEGLIFAAGAGNTSIFCISIINGSCSCWPRLWFSGRATIQIKRQSRASFI